MLCVTRNKDQSILIKDSETGELLAKIKIISNHKHVKLGVVALRKYKILRDELNGTECTSDIEE